MAIRIFPTVNDVAPTAGGGQTLSEANLAAWIRSLGVGNFVISGFTLPASSPNLNITASAGRAVIGGYLVETDAALAVTCAAGGTNYLFLQLTRDASQNVTGVRLVASQSDAAPADSVRLGQATLSGSTVTATTERRPITLVPRWFKPGSTFLLASYSGSDLRSKSITATPNVPALWAIPIRWIGGRFRLTGVTRTSSGSGATSKVTIGRKYLRLAESSDGASWVEIIAGTFTTTSTSNVAFTLDTTEIFFPGDVLNVTCVQTVVPGTMWYAYMNNLQVTADADPDGPGVSLAESMPYSTISN